MVCYGSSRITDLGRYWDNWGDETPSNLRNILFNNSTGSFDSGIYSKSPLVDTPHVVYDSVDNAVKALEGLSLLVDGSKIEYINTYGFAFCHNFAYNNLRGEMRAKGTDSYEDSRVFISYFKYQYQGQTFKFGMAFSGLSLPSKRKAESLSSVDVIIKEAKMKSIEAFIKQCRKATIERSSKNGQVLQ